MLSSTRTTLLPGNEVSASIAKPSREKSSWMVRNRIFRPFQRLSWMKSSDQHSLMLSGTLCGSPRHRAVFLRRRCGTCNRAAR